MIFKKVALGLSGGVDSAVSAYLLKKKGFEVIGVFMKNWDGRDEIGYCTNDKDFEDAQLISNHLKIPLVQVNYVKEYWNDVFTDFLNDYKQGWTPNPDILCNKNIKFNLFFKHAMENLKCHAIATGHYACSSFGPFLENFDDKSEVRLLQATDSFKDQTFFLSQIHQSALRHCMFPIGYLNKHQVKEICTNEIGLPQITQKKESIGICFIGDRSFMNFIEEYIEPKPGNFVDIDNGKIVGKHKGIHCYTLGQRVGIGGVPKPYFVYRKNPETSDIFVASGTDHHLMYSDIFFTKNPCWIRKSPFNEKSYIQCQFRFQHTKPLVDCKIVKANFDESKILVLLNEPLRSITPGQYAVFYKDNECLGSSRIFEFSSIIK